MLVLLTQAAFLFWLSLFIPLLILGFIASKLAEKYLYPKLRAKYNPGYGQLKKKATPAPDPVNTFPHLQRRQNAAE
jgi:hypothetical protein